MFGHHFSVFLGYLLKQESRCFMGLALSMVLYRQQCWGNAGNISAGKQQMYQFRQTVEISMQPNNRNINAVCHNTLTPARTARLGMCHNILTPTRTPSLALCHNTLTPARTARLGLCHNTLAPGRTPRLGLCHSTLTPARTARLGLCHNTLTPARTPRLGLCHNTLTPARTPRPVSYTHLTLPTSIVV